MVTATPGQSLPSTLAGWRELVEAGPDGPGIDFTESNRTRRCRELTAEFIEGPSEESFRTVWSADALCDYWRPNAASILNQASGNLDELADVFAEIRDASSFDPAWAGRCEGCLDGAGLYELYARLHADQEPIPTSEASNALERFGFDTGDDRASCIAAIERFHDEYEQSVGHVTEEMEYEVPVYAEIDELFRLVETVDRDTINAQLTGPYADFFRPFIGYRMGSGRADPIEWDDVSSLLDDHLEARDSGAYDDNTTEHWGGTHAETWKWEFKDYFQDVIASEFDLTDLSPGDVPAFFDAISEPEKEIDIVSDVPKKMMGGRRHSLTWNDLVEHFCENPEEGAVVLSDLFDEELPVEDRLNEFHDFTLPVQNQEENPRGPGSILRAATTLLMYAYPDRYLAFQYRRTSDFFAAHTNVDGLDTGYDASQYHEVVIACRRLLEELQRRTDEASMIDVQTLIYVGHDAAK